MVTSVSIPLLAAAMGLLAMAPIIGAVAADRQPGPRVLDASGPIAFFIADGRPDTGFRATDRQLAEWAFAAWQRAAPERLRFEPASEADAIVRLYWAGPDEGKYGEMLPLLVGARRGAAVFVRPDMDALGSDIARRTRGDALLRDSIVYLTSVHEIGHALGLSHTNDFRDVMYYFGYGGSIADYFGRYRAELRSRADIATAAGLSKMDVSRMREMYKR
jgi:hypothetical protein